MTFAVKTEKGATHDMYQARQVLMNTEAGWGFMIVLWKENVMSESNTGNLKQQTKKGLYWSFFNQFANYGMQFCVGIVIRELIEKTPVKPFLCLLFFQSVRELRYAVLCRYCNGTSAVAERLWYNGTSGGIHGGGSYSSECRIG